MEVVDLRQAAVVEGVTGTTAAQIQGLIQPQTKMAAAEKYRKGGWAVGRSVVIIVGVNIIIFIDIAHFNQITKTFMVLNGAKLIQA